MQRILIVAQATGGAGKSIAVRRFAEAVRNAPRIKFGPAPRRMAPDNSRFKGPRMIGHALGLTNRILVVRAGRQVADTKSVRLAYLLESTALRGSSARCASRENH